MQFVYKILPYWVTYTEEGLATWMGGRTSFLSIKINPHYRDDTSLLLHEVEHIKQTYRTCFLHDILYGISNKYKLYSECQAYIAAQITLGTMTIEQVVDSLYSNYNLGMTKEYISEYLTNMVEKSK
jgi:hypothetical protein